MKPELRFEDCEMMTGYLGEESGVPDLLGSLILQNQLAFKLDEDDEIYEGYGSRPNAYPYRHYNCYSRSLKKRVVRTAVLENDHLKAVFLPEFGGRLWSLWDKAADRNLLYTNDVIRFSNLAVRNAWFSGGVEWNIGVIGHTPLTTEPLFTAVSEDGQGNPVLRMYEYERIRGVEYQMDFWLGKEDRFLNCRMRIMNGTDEVKPMYWWSNMAVPEYEGGRIAVPAAEAYTCAGGTVRKVGIPLVEGIDISDYKKIPDQVDYFFDIPGESPKYIANLDSHGYGLLHISTDRLQSRKLFSWGKSGASDRWQEFLTEDAGRYVEIQAGLGKTQYGCIPMAPYTAWEWMELYGAVGLEQETAGMPFEKLCRHVEEQVKKQTEQGRLGKRLEETKAAAKTPAKTVIMRGRGYGQMEGSLFWGVGERKRALSGHLDFDFLKGLEGEREDDRALCRWKAFLETGVLHEPEINLRPDYLAWGEKMALRLEGSLESANRDNWYAWYQAGLCRMEQRMYQKAAQYFERSADLKKNPWAYHGLAAAHVLEGRKKEAAAAITAGLVMRLDDLSYVKEAFRILLLCGEEQQVKDFYEQLPETFQQESRIRFSFIVALHRLGMTQVAYGLLTEGDGLVLDDIREGEDSIGELWSEMQETLYGTTGEIPHWFDFKSIV